MNTRIKLQGSPEEEDGALCVLSPACLLLSCLQALRWHIRVGVLLGGNPTSSAQCSVVVSIEL